MDAITSRGAERLLVVAGAIFLTYLGYRLFDKGQTDGDGKLKFESAMMKIVFSGTGSGLFFIAFGAAILLTSLLYGGATMDSIEASMKKINDTTSAQASELSTLKQNVEGINSSTKGLIYSVSKQQSLKNTIPDPLLKNSPEKLKAPIDLNEVFKNNSKGESQ